MILVNQQLKANKEYKTHREMFPRLYYQNFSGEWSQIRHVSIEIINGNIDVQTDLSDAEAVYKYVTEWIEKEKKSQNKKLQEAQNILKIINEVARK